MASCFSTDTELLGEPSLEEILADPMVVLMMKRDGVKPQQMRGEIDRLQSEYSLLLAAV